MTQIIATVDIAAVSETWLADPATKRVLNYDYGIMKFVDLIAYKTLIEMLKVKTNLLPIGIQSLFRSNSNSYNTRQSGKFIQKYVRTTMKSITVSVAGVKLWNSRKTNITTIITICVFKKMCKLYFLGKYINNI